MPEDRKEGYVRVVNDYFFLAKDNMGKHRHARDYIKRNKSYNIRESDNNAEKTVVVWQTWGNNIFFAVVFFILFFYFISKIVVSKVF